MFPKKNDDALKAIKQRNTQNNVDEYEYKHIDGFMFRNIKSITYIALETFHHSMFHFIDTVKIRSQARNLTQDVSFYFKNKVVEKPVISGLVSGFLGGFSGAFTFIWVYNNLTWKMYGSEAYQHMDFRLK